MYYVKILFFKLADVVFNFLQHLSLVCINILHKKSVMIEIWQKKKCIYTYDDPERTALLFTIYYIFPLSGKAENPSKSQKTVASLNQF